VVPREPALLKRLRLLAGVGVSIGLFVYLLHSVDLAQLGRQLALTQWWWVVAGVTVGPLGLWARAMRWRYLFPQNSEPPGLVAANMIGYMANNILPLRAGELVRIYVAARRRAGPAPGSLGSSVWLIGATVVIERVLDSLTLVLFLAVLVFFIPVPRAFEYAAALILVADALAAALLVALAVAPDLSRRLVVRVCRRWPALERRATAVLETFRRGLEGVKTPAHVGPLLAWTGLTWALPVFGAWALLRAVHLDLSLLAGWTVLTFVGFGISIPSAPGYIGVWHAAAVLALSMFGVSQATAVGYAILYHASQIVPITVVGWLFLVREHMTLGEATRARAVQSPIA
jgi:uncharacterized protein (TIRG00374 family)